MVMILSSSCLDLVMARVQGGGLSPAGRTGDQHHAVGLGDVRRKFFNVFFVKAHDIQAEILELLAHRFLVEDAKYSILTMDRQA